MAFDQDTNIVQNDRLRIPQREGWSEIREHYRRQGSNREVGIVLPVGCGKSGLIALTPFAVTSQRALVIAPGTRIRGQLGADLRSNSPTNFYDRCQVIGGGQDFPETTIVASGRVNMDDIRHADITVANIQQISGEENRWLDGLPQDFST